MQSKDIKTLNLDKDFEEMMKKVKQAGWDVSTRTTGFWTQEADEHQKSSQLCTHSRRWKA